MLNGKGTASTASISNKLFSLNADDIAGAFGTMRNVPPKLRGTGLREGSIFSISLAENRQTRCQICESTRLGRNFVFIPCSEEYILHT